MKLPETRYAKSGDIHIAYQVTGKGPLDLVYVPGFVSNVEYAWGYPRLAEFYRRLASFSRLVLFDKRGTGVSDRVKQMPTLEQRMDDVRAVMDAVGSERAAVMGISEGAPMAALFAATYPQRTVALVLYGSLAKGFRTLDHPWVPSADEWPALIERLERRWGSPEYFDENLQLMAPSAANDEEFRRWWTAYRRLSASPAAAADLARMNSQIDVSHALPAIRVPTLVLHRAEDRDVPAAAGRYVAERIQCVGKGAFRHLIPPKVTMPVRRAPLGCLVRGGRSRAGRRRFRRFRDRFRTTRPRRAPTPGPGGRRGTAHAAPGQKPVGRATFTGRPDAAPRRREGESAMRIKTLLGVWISAIIAVLSLPTGAPAQALPGAGQGPIVGSAVAHDTSPELRHLPVIPPTAGPKAVELRRPRLPRHAPRVKLGRDPVLQDFSGPVSMPSATTFDGVSNVNGVLPPDPNGAVGPNHYVQWVNLSFAVYSKAGALLYGPAGGNTHWQGFGGPCQTENGGDPIVLYDKQADRWFMSQLAYPNFPSGPFYQCIAVSQTGDPLGAYYRYAFVISDTALNDYPKFGVWPDGYYLAVNQFVCYDLIPPFGFYVCDWAGQGAFAFERDTMLAGQPAQMIGFTLPLSNLGGMLPSDWDGPTPPPLGAPNVFVQADDDVWFSPALPQDRLQLWPFHVDWANPALSTFGPNPPGADVGQVLDVQPFDSNMCDYSANCIPQPGFDLIGQPSPSLDALADRLMYRLQYRNFGTHETLVVNHTVDVDGTDHAGIRWYELRNDGSGWSIYQQGTYAPDARHRWMGSIAMDGAGNIALGFSLSSRAPDTYPSVVYVGRLAADPLGTLPEAETVLWAGNGAQEDSSGRWGDYSSMSIDPTDDCTFWYTHEYYPSTDVITGINWRTRIGSFRFASCGGGGTDTPPTVSLTSPANGATVSGTVPVTATATDDHGVTRVEFFVDGTSIGVDTDGSNGWSASWNTTTAANGGHTVTATATDTIGQTSSSSNLVTVANASTTSMGVFSIGWGTGRNLTVTVTVRRDSDASGSLTGADLAVNGASVALVLTLDKNGNGTFECGGADSCWTFSGSTNSKGQVSFKLIGAPAGLYQARVTGLTRSSYTWAPSLDLDNPDTFTK